MDPDAKSIIEQFEYMLKINDAQKAWDLQGCFVDVRNRLDPNSPDRMMMDDLWKRMRLKWN